MATKAKRQTAAVKAAATKVTGNEAQATQKEAQAQAPKFDVSPESLALLQRGREGMLQQREQLQEALDTLNVRIQNQEGGILVMQRLLGGEPSRNGNGAA